MKHLTCHLDRLRACLAQLPDPRRGRNRQYTMQDIGLAALSVFFMQSPSFLAHQRTLAEQRGRSNAHTLFGLTRIPCDNHIRHLLDGVPPDRFEELFQHIVEDLDAAGGLGEMRRLDGRVLIALDGTEYFRSRKISCPNCSTRARRDGATEYFHQVLAATLVAPGHAQALPLPPEFIRPQDGHAKQDCERQAVKRWLRRLGPRYGALRPVYLGDDLYACQPVCEAIRAVRGRFILTCKPDSHPTLYEYLHGIALKTHRTVVGRGRPRRIHRYRFMTGLPLRDGDDALRVNWFEIEIARPNGAVTYRNAFVTDLAVNRDTIAELAACGRGPLENRERNVQCPQASGLPPRTQLRPRQEDPGQRAGRAEPARLRPARGLRPDRNPVATGTPTPRIENPDVRTPAHDHLLSPLPVVDRADDTARHRKRALTASLSSAQHAYPSERNRQAHNAKPNSTLSDIERTER